MRVRLEPQHYVLGAIPTNHKQHASGGQRQDSGCHSERHAHSPSLGLKPDSRPMPIASALSQAFPWVGVSESIEEYRIDNYPGKGPAPSVEEVGTPWGYPCGMGPRVDWSLFAWNCSAKGFFFKLLCVCSMLA